LDFFYSMCNKFGTPFVLELERRPSPIMPKGSPSENHRLNLIPLP